MMRRPRHNGRAIPATVVGQPFKGCRAEDASMMRPLWPFALIAIALVMTASAQRGTAPRNDLPQPYHTTRDWGELPPGVKWAAVTAVEPAPDGTIYVIHRCFANSCAGRSEAPILKYNAQGKLLKAFGEDLFIFPHGATVDATGNLWVTD